MAADGEGRGRGSPPRPDCRGAVSLNVRVVPDVPSFSVDDGFAYSVPEGMDLEVGHLVRVPLGGRRVRGWVVSTAEPDRDDLRAVASRSGDLPCFDPKLLGVLRWAALHYVAPLSTVLAKATPPNLPRGEAAPAASVPPRQASRIVVGRPPWGALVAEEAAGHLESGRSVMVVAPTVFEAEEVAKDLEARLDRKVTAVSSQLSGAEVTRHWVTAASRPGTLVVGTREVAAWPVASLALAVVLGEGRRGMKDKATPTLHTRDLLLKRAGAQRFSLILAGSVPTPEALAFVPSVVRKSRPWGLVEVVDRRGEPPGGGLLAQTTAAALRATAGRILLFSHRRHGAQRCVRCGRLRTCVSCGSGPGADSCARCGAEAGGCPHCGGKRFETLGAPVSRLLAEARRLFDSREVGPAESGRRVVAGSERDLPGLEVDLTVVVDADGPLLAPNYRSGEEGLRILARAVAAAGSGRGRRAIVQTVDPDHPAIETLRRGDPLAFLVRDSRERAAMGFPPGGEVMVVEASPASADMAGEMRDAIGDRAQVLGPLESNGGLRWLLQGGRLDPARVVLRRLVSQWRESGRRVRVDADPVDL